MWAKYFATAAPRQPRFTPRFTSRLFGIWPSRGQPLGVVPMALVDEVQEYLAIRRAFGAKLEDLDRHLRQFVAFLKAKRAPFVTTQLALQWATRPIGVSKVH